MSSKNPKLWTPDSLKNAALSTGRTLEVRTAAAFPKSNWAVLLNTYYADIVTGSVRELDVTAQRGFQDRSSKEPSWNFQVHVSCRSFPTGCRPVMYVATQETDSLTTFTEPRLLFDGARPLRNAEHYGATLAFYLSRDLFGEMGPSSRILAFDVYEEERAGIKPKGDRKMKGDRDSLFPAMDSAIKSAAYWWQLDRKHPNSFSVYVPMLVLSEPWIQVQLEAAAPKEFSEGNVGYMFMGYPFAGAAARPEWFMSLICTMDALPGVVKALLRISETFRYDVQNR